MTRPTPSQKASFERGRPAVIGGHTIGGPDGGPGLPGVDWSVRHGDLVFHTFLVCMDCKPSRLLYALFIRRRGTQRSQTNLVAVSAASYAALALLVGWQALRGQSIVQPDAATLVALLFVGHLHCRWSFYGLTQSRRESSRSGTTSLKAETEPHVARIHIQTR